jgi:RNA polymerase sigma factor (sigma-70 family)
MTEKIRKMARTYNELSSEMQRAPSDEMVAERLGWSVEDIREVKDAMPGATTSLNQPLTSDEGSSELGEIVEDERSSDTPGTVMSEMETSQLREAIVRIPERYRHVLVRRYGLDYKNPATLAELGDELKISRERVRQLQLKAEGVLRRGEFGCALRATSDLKTAAAKSKVVERGKTNEPRWGKSNGLEEHLGREHAEVARVREIWERRKRSVLTYKWGLRSALASGDKRLVRRWSKSLREAEDRLAWAEKDLARAETRARSEHAS